jgi:hypothetical protein
VGIIAQDIPDGTVKRIDDAYSLPDKYYCVKF